MSAQQLLGRLSLRSTPYTVPFLVLTALILSFFPAILLLFALVFIFFPLGFAARILGIDGIFKKYALSINWRALETAYFEIIISTNASPLSLLKLGVYLVSCGWLIKLSGFRTTLSLVGLYIIAGTLILKKTRSLASCVYMNYDFVKLHIKLVFLHVLNYSKDLGTVTISVISGGVVAAAIFLSFQLTSSSYAFAAALELSGYVILTVCCICPASWVQDLLDLVTPSPLALESFLKSAQADKWVKSGCEIILWHRFIPSFIWLSVLYIIYSVSARWGFVAPVAFVAGAYVAIYLSPREIATRKNSSSIVTIPLVIPEDYYFNPSSLCIICCEQDRCKYFTPCKHFVTCGQCFESLIPRICPICRTWIDQGYDVIVG